MNDRLAAAANKTRHVLKFPLELKDVQQIRMPVGTEVVHVHEQHGVPTLWAETPAPADPGYERTFRLIPTGGTVEAAWGAMYLGTVRIDWTVWHVYESVR